MKTIIVPLDFSKESLTGLNQALMLANTVGANIQLVHVILKNEGKGNEIIVKERLEAKFKFDSILEVYNKKINSKSLINYTLKEGLIFKETTNLSEKFDDSLIVLSTHGESGFEELFIGGNAYKIISHSKVPVISVRKGKISSKINKIVLPFDNSLETREKVPYTVNIAKQFNAEIHLVTVRLSNSNSIEKKLLQYAEQAASYIDKNKIPYTITSLHGDNLTDLILDYSHSVNADLISIMTEQEKSISNLLLGSYAHQMINKSTIPVLSFPNYQIQVLSEDFSSIG
ncbi:MAG: universal stress protein [Bacteroidia bacterium]|nr:universal stress protein [Bacteroidia bacterium]